MKTKEQVVREIKALLDEFLMLAGEEVLITQKGMGNGKSASPKTQKDDKYTGCMGGIMYLHDKDFFKTPKGRKEVVDELKREGWHYAPALVSMNLLALNRKRTLTRLPDKKKKGWVYVIRK